MIYISWRTYRTWRINCTICNKRSKRRNRFNYEESPFSRSETILGRKWKIYSIIVFLFSATKFTGDLRSSNEGEVEWFTKEEMKNINLVNYFFEHLAVFEGDYSEYIYESEDSIKIY